MAYLDPPPFPAPVIVMKDIGGLVSDYQARTEQYRREFREVRLHECRSACTLALSLPNVCVYPSSLLKFHKAYDWNTKVRDDGVSAELFAAYPAVIQAKLGGLTRDYRVLSGAELIALGFRNCQDGATQIARARPKSGEPSPVQVASAVFDPANAVGELLKSVVGALPGATTGSAQPNAAAASRPNATARLASFETASTTTLAVNATAVPLPPVKPAEFAGAVQVANADVPLPPRPPGDIIVYWPRLPKLITGAEPVLPATILAYADGL